MYNELSQLGPENFKFFTNILHGKFVKTGVFTQQGGCNEICCCIMGILGSSIFGYIPYPKRYSDRIIYSMTMLLKSK